MISLSGLRPNRHNLINNFKLPKYLLPQKWFESKQINTKMLIYYSFGGQKKKFGLYGYHVLGLTCTTSLIIVIAKKMFSVKGNIFH